MAGAGLLGRVSAARTEAVQPVPVLQRDGVHQQSGVPVRQHRADLPQPGRAGVAVQAPGQALAGQREVRDAVPVGAQEVPVAGLRRLERGQQHEFGALRGVDHEGLAAGDRQHPGGRVAPGRRQPGLVEAVLGRPVHPGPGQCQVQRALGLRHGAHRFHPHVVNHPDE